MVRVRFGKFDRASVVYPGDIFRMNLSSEKEDRTFHEQTVETTIQVTQTITDWCMIYIPGVGFGGLFGNEKLREKILSIYKDAYEVPVGEAVIKD